LRHTLSHTGTPLPVPRETSRVRCEFCVLL
jgi:hypothetical protein